MTSEHQRSRGRWVGLFLTAMMVLGGCSAKTPGGPKVIKAETLALTCQARWVSFDASERYITAELARGDGEPPEVRVFDSRQSHTVVAQVRGWAVGPADHQGVLTYLERRDKDGAWILRAPGRVLERRITPPAGVAWQVGATLRTSEHAVVVFTEQTPWRHKQFGVVRRAWAVSVDSGRFKVAVTRKFMVTQGFGQQSITGSLAADVIYWAELPKTASDIGPRPLSLHAVDAASLTSRWKVNLTAPSRVETQSPENVLAVTGDGLSVLIILGGWTPGGLSPAAVYGVRAKDGRYIFGPHPPSLERVRDSTIHALAPVPGRASVALLHVFDLRDERDKFQEVLVVDVPQAKITHQVNKGPNSAAVVVRRSGTPALSPTYCTN